MRQERITKRPQRRRQGGGGAPDPLPVPGRPASSKQSLSKADDLLRRLERLLSH